MKHLGTATNDEILVSGFRLTRDFFAKYYGQQFEELKAIKKILHVDFDDLLEG